MAATRRYRWSMRVDAPRAPAFDAAPPRGDRATPINAFGRAASSAAKSSMQRAGPIGQVSSPGLTSTPRQSCKTVQLAATGVSRSQAQRGRE
jgi:hypothetical protein